MFIECASIKFAIYRMHVSDVIWYNAIFIYFHFYMPYCDIDER